jgi:quercetin dioxygenase-like cupin family protein
VNTAFNFRKWCIFSAIVLCGFLTKGTPAAGSKGQRSSRMTFSHKLPALDGGRLAVHIVEVSYGSGGASPPHSHPCPVVGYVLEGAIRTQVEGQPEATYKVGESFYEGPNGVHLVSASASNTESAKLLAFFVCDHDAPLSADVKREQR